jgi:uncharacterized protein (TIGR02271 family)
MGTPVFTADGRRLGRVAAVSEREVVVEQGDRSSDALHIPDTAIAGFDGERIRLTVTENEARHARWDAALAEPSPSERVAGFDASGTATYVAEQDALRAETGAAGVRAHMGESSDSPGLAGDLTRSGEHVESTDDDEVIRIPLHEEELVARKRTRQTGDAWIVKGVVEEAQARDVPVTEEHARVTKRTVDRDLETGDVVIEETTMRVPLSQEEIEVERRTRVSSEAVVEREPVEETARVTGTVRKERARVDDGTDAHDAVD